MSVVTPTPTARDPPGSVFPRVGVAGVKHGLGVYDFDGTELLHAQDRCDADAAIVVVGEGDRITPMAHGEKLAKHFGGELVVFPGGHLLQLGRREGFKAAMRMLRRRGVVRS